MAGAETRLIALDHLVHSINEKDQPERLHSPYVHFVDEYISLRFGDRPPQSFFIGGGGFSLPRAWIAKYHGKADITIAEIDPQVTDIAKAKLWFSPDGSQTKVIHGDARYELNKLADDVKFDLVFGDAFHDISIPEHLVTKEFNDLIAQRLHDDGVYLVNVVDMPNARYFCCHMSKPCSVPLTGSKSGSSLIQDSTAYEQPLLSLAQTPRLKMISSMPKMHLNEDGGVGQIAT